MEDAFLPDTLDPSTLLPVHLYNPQLYEGYSLTDQDNAQSPTATPAPSTGGDPQSAESLKNRERRERAAEREKNRRGISALLPDENIIEPPHDPDETIPAPYVRPCSMARPDVPLGKRCIVVLKADYAYRMCEGCRMRFKLSEIRLKGIRYEGKYKARETPDERGGHPKHKPRPQLIQYNGELILDPAYMHTYNLDPRMFGSQALKNNAVANTEANFAQTLKNATIAVSGKKSRECSAAARQSTEPPPSATPGSSGNSEPAKAMPYLHLPSDELSTSQYSTLVSASSPQASTSAKEINDGLLRVRICSVKNCHNPVPIDYHWKMCKPCRDEHKVWSVQKRARKRQKRLEQMSQEEKEKLESAYFARYDRSHSTRDDSGNAEPEVEFDPTIPPRPCSISSCKNHITGNTTWKRCDAHRRESRMTQTHISVKRERQKEVYKKAIDEGRDPEEALKKLLLQQDAEDMSDSEDEQVGGVAVVLKKKGKKRKRDVGFTNNLVLHASSRTALAVCNSKECMNLLHPEAPFRQCEPCRLRETVEHNSKSKKTKNGNIGRQSTSQRKEAVHPHPGLGTIDPPIASRGDQAVSMDHNDLTGVSEGTEQVSSGRLPAKFADTPVVLSSGGGWHNYSIQNSYQSYTNAESSLQLAVISDTSDPARTVISETDSQVASPISTKNFATNEIKTKISSEAETPAHYQGQTQTNTITFMPPNHVVGHTSSQARSAQSVSSGGAVTDPSNVLAAKPTSTRKRKVGVPPETLGASAGSTLFINDTHSRPAGKPGRPRKNAPLFTSTSDTSPAVPPSTQLASLLPQPSPGMYPYAGYMPCAPPYMSYPPSLNTDGISAPPMSPYWCHPLMMPVPGPDPAGQMYGHPPYPYQYTYAYSYLPPMPISSSAADAPLLSPHPAAAPTFTSNGPSIHRFSAAFAQQAQVNTLSNTSPGTSSEHNQQSYVENTSAQAASSETFSDPENITQAPSNSDTAITTAETQLKWQTPGSVPYGAINIKFGGFCSQLTAQNSSNVSVIVSNSRPENSAANERVDRPGPSTVDISCSDAADNDTTDRPTGVKGSDASAGSGSHQGRSDWTDGMAQSSDAVEGSSQTKICETKRCSAFLPVSRPFKYCTQCRKMLKARKKVVEMKRRLKLISS